MQPGSGILQGDGFACVLFLEAYHPAVDSWHASLSQAVGDEFLATDPVSGQSLSLATTSYADDVSRKHVVQSADDMAHRAYLSSMLLEDALGQIELAQNEDKQAHHVVFRGPSADSNMRAAYGGDLVPSRVVRCIKYLGGLSHYSGGNSAEISARIQAAKTGWCCMGKFWSKPSTAKRPVLSIFKCHVHSRLMSGLEARVLLQGELVKLDRTVLTYGRKLMRGEACVKITAEDGSTQYHALPSINVWRFLQLAPVRVELQIRRLRYWQSVARRPHLHAAVLAAVFGKLVFETRPTTDDTGRLTPRSNPWARLFQEDLEALGGCDDGRDLVAELDGRVLVAFSLLRDAFVAIDCSVLRRQFLSVAIPPPEFVDAPIPAPPDPVEVDRPHKCDCLRDDGTPCEASFASWQRLVVHKTSTKTGTHGRPSLARQATVANVCPWCRHIFATKRVAQQHIQRALCKRRCTGKGSNTVFAVVPESLCCPFCQHEHDSMDELLTCITAHVVGPNV